MLPADPTSIIFVASLTSMLEDINVSEIFSRSMNGNISLIFSTSVTLGYRLADLEVDATDVSVTLTDGNSLDIEKECSILPIIAQEETFVAAGNKLVDEH